MKTEESTSVAIYATHSQAEQAIIKLHEKSFDIRKLSIVEKEYYMRENVIGFRSDEDGMPERQLEYESELKAGKYLLLVRGTPQDVEKALKILGIHIPKENLVPAPAPIVLSGGERSAFQ